MMPARLQWVRVKPDTYYDSPVGYGREALARRHGRKHLRARKHERRG